MTEVKNSARILSIWLFFCAFMVMAMTGIGAVTRLTESGLSITEWNVISGTLPPLTESDWLIEFSKYQATPEFSAKHHWMTLSDFKGIYFWEWFHRFWGRMIGIVFGLPMIFFWLKGMIPRQDRMKFLGLLILGGAQGGLGWFMVKSGLVDRPSVSHFRLAAHLTLALTIYSALIWMAIRYAQLSKFTVSNSLRLHGILSLIMVVITIIWGAFVAGLDAGMIYNSFPWMGDGLIPPEFGQNPFLSDPASVQMTHRFLAMASLVTVLSYGIRWFRISRSIGASLSIWIIIQVMLGVVTLLSVVAIPIATLHQLGAVVLLTLVIYSLYAAIPSRARIS